VKVLQRPGGKGPLERGEEMSRRFPAVTGQKRPLWGNSGGTTDILFALSRLAQGIFIPPCQSKYKELFPWKIAKKRWRKSSLCVKAADLSF